LRRLGQSLFLAGGVGVLVSALAGWAVARNGLRPVRRLTLAVENAARTERLTPVPAEGDDEVGRLGAAFNSLIATVEASRARQRQLVADAGHELRTPLTSLRTNLDLLAMADADGGLPRDARAELIEDVRAQIEELSTLVGDLVELARDDPPGAEVETVDLADVAERAVARVRRRAPAVTFETELDSWPVTVEEHAVERALTNLLDNAAKWSPDGGTVTMRIADGVLTVDDEGPGIPADDLPHVFDRFYRASESRGMPGSGLGLSIVRQVAERHGGSVDAEPSPAGGARMSLRLPRAKD
jgi:two-component system sensor histidine kinase MprB